MRLKNKAKGYQIERSKRYSGDGGVDGKLCINGQWHLLQAKRYRGHVRMDHIQEFHRLCESNRVKGLFIHTGKTPQRVYQERDRLPWIQIVSGGRLLEFLTVTPQLVRDARPAFKQNSGILRKM